MGKFQIGDKVKLNVEQTTAGTFMTETENSKPLTIIANNEKYDTVETVSGTHQLVDPKHMDLIERDNIKVGTFVYFRPKEKSLTLSLFDYPEHVMEVKSFRYSEELGVWYVRIREDVETLTQTEFLHHVVNAEIYEKLQYESTTIVSNLYDAVKKLVVGIWSKIEKFTIKF